ncbi:MAG: GNAT family N-acetyltransferase [Opitutae bacterium]|nr:GNAT family N-acetyltransferase [Opitutae bacterium]
MTSILDSKAENNAPFGFSIRPMKAVVHPDHDTQLALSYRWLSFLSTVYGFEFRVLEAEGAALRLPFAPIHDIYGPRLVAVPFTDYIDPQADDALIAEAAAFLRNSYPQHAITLRLSGNYPGLLATGFEAIRSAYCHRLHFEGTAEQLWERTEHSFRKNVGKAMRGQVTVAPMNDQQGLDAFYCMLTRLRRHKFHALPHSRRHYENLLETFTRSSAGNLWVARLGDKPIAAAFILHADGWLIDKMGVSDAAHLDLCPNNLLLWEVIKFGLARGMRGLDMGLTPGDNAGLKRFKETLGCVATPITFYRGLPSTFDQTRERALRDMLTNITATFVRDDVPDAATQAAAEVLYRYFC